MTKPALPQKYYWSIDIESVGPRLTDSVIAIGTCFGPADGSWSRERLHKKLIRLRPRQGDTVDQSTMTEFWDKNAAVYAELTEPTGRADARVAIFHLLVHAVELVKAYEVEIDGGTIEIVTDCPDYDLGRLNHLAYEMGFSELRPVRFMGTERWHTQRDPSERLDALGEEDACARWIAANVPGVVHNHRPDNDAEYTYYQMVYLHQRRATSQPGISR